MNKNLNKQLDKKHTVYIQNMIVVWLMTVLYKRYKEHWVRPTYYISSTHWQCTVDLCTGMALCTSIADKFINMCGWLTYGVHRLVLSYHSSLLTVTEGINCLKWRIL